MVTTSIIKIILTDGLIDSNLQHKLSFFSLQNIKEKIIHLEFSEVIQDLGKEGMSSPSTLQFMVNFKDIFQIPTFHGQFESYLQLRANVLVFRSWFNFFLREFQIFVPLSAILMSCTNSSQTFTISMHNSHDVMTHLAQIPTKTRRFTHLPN
jgi:hypothetical protein